MTRTIVLLLVGIIIGYWYCNRGKKKVEAQFKDFSNQVKDNVRDLFSNDRNWIMNADPEQVAESVTTMKIESSNFSG